MGKGDKKTRRGKIILGSFGVRRLRKKDNKPSIKPLKVTAEKEVKEKKPLKEKKEVKEVKVAAEVAETKVVKEKAPVKTPVKAPAKAPKAANDEKAVKEVKPKKEKKG